MNIALLGLPQAGKKTLFALLTGRHVPESHRPGDVLEGVAAIRDARVDTLARLCQPRHTVYATNHFLLCPDVTEGAGARAWQDAARRCDLLCLVVRGFSAPEVFHPAGSVDPERDATLIRNELLLADLELTEKRLERLAKEKRAGISAAQLHEEKVLARCRAALENSTRLDQLDLAPEDRAALRHLELLTLIPVLTVYNVDEEAVGHDYGPGTLTVSARIEEEIMAIADETERREYLASLGLQTSGVDRLNAAAFRALGLVSFYTTANQEVRAWTVRRGTPAAQAAGKVHTDMERGFIRAEVVKFDDLVAAGSEHAARAQGHLQARGRDYVIEDGDVCHFLFHV